MTFPEQVHRIELPTPYPVGPVNVYLLDGDEPALVDAGVWSSRSIGVLESQLAEHGRRLADVRRILVTHDHTDHAGAARRLSQQCGATLCMHRRGERPTKWADTRQPLFDFLLRCAVPRDWLENAFRMFGKEGSKFDDRSAVPHDVFWLAGGERIALGGVELEVVATPGHAPDHLCFVEPASGTLFCGDMLLPRVTPNPLLYLDPHNQFRRHHALLDYLSSLALLAGRSFSAGCPGHGPAISDVAELLAQNRVFVERRRRRYAALFGHSPITPFELARALFGELDLMNQYLAVSETVAYLDLLERDGLIGVDWNAETIVAWLRND